LVKNWPAVALFTDKAKAKTARSPIPLRPKQNKVAFFTVLPVFVSLKRHRTNGLNKKTVMRSTARRARGGTLTGAGVADHLDAAAVAGLQGRLVPRQGRVVEGVLAADVAPAVALVAVDGPRCATKNHH